MHAACSDARCSASAMLANGPKGIAPILTWTPAGLLARSVVLWLLFLTAHAAGLRRCTSILSGTVPEGSIPLGQATILGTAYIVLYLGAMVVAPVMAVAAALGYLWRAGERATRYRPS